MRRRLTAGLLFMTLMAVGCCSVNGWTAPARQLSDIRGSHRPLVVSEYEAERAVSVAIGQGPPSLGQQHGSEASDFHKNLRLALKEGDTLLYRIVLTPEFINRKFNEITEPGAGYHQRQELEGQLVLRVTKADAKSIELSWDSIDLGKGTPKLKKGRVTMSRSGLIIDFNSSESQVENGFLYMFLLPDQPVFVGRDEFKRSTKSISGGRFEFDGRVIAVDMYNRYWKLKYYATSTSLGINLKRYFEFASTFDKKLGLVVRSSSEIFEGYFPWKYSMELKSINGKEYVWEEGMFWDGWLE